MLHVRIDEYGRLEVTADPDTVTQLQNELDMVNGNTRKPFMQESEYTWHRTSQRWLEAICDAAAFAGIPGLMVVEPVEVVALVDDMTPLIVDTGFKTEDWSETHVDMWVDSPIEGFKQLNAKYNKRMWYDNAFAIRDWMGVLALNNEVVFDLNHDVDFDAFTDWLPIKNGDVIEFEWPEQGTVQAEVWNITTHRGQIINCIEDIDPTPDRRPHRYAFCSYYVKGLRIVESAGDVTTDVH